MITGNERAASRRGVLVSLTREGPDFRISLDDVKCKDELSGQWVVAVHYTSKLISGEVFEQLEFDEKELADFGLAVLARIYAFNRQNEI